MVSENNPHQCKRLHCEMVKIFLLSVLFLAGCSSAGIRLVDEYYVYPPDEYSETYYLKCKLSGDSDPEIDSLRIVYWNDTVIMAGRGSGELSWWIIKASGRTLKCCNGDTVAGPFTEKYVQERLKNEKGTYRKLVLE